MAYYNYKTSTISKEEENYVRSSLLLTGISPRVVRVLFDKHFPPSTLQPTLNREKMKLENLQKKRIITQRQMDIMFPRYGTPSSVDIDITLMVCLLRNLCRLVPAVYGFDAMPPPSDMTEVADLARIKYYRNFLAHIESNTLDQTHFNQLWREVTGAISRLGGPSFLDECCDLKIKFLDRTNLDLRAEMENATAQMCNVRKEFEMWKEEMKDYLTVLQSDSKEDPKLLVPSSLSACNVGQENIAICWEPPQSWSVGDIRGYKIFWRKQEGDTLDQVTGGYQVSADQRYHNIGDLQPFTKYLIWVLAYLESHDLPRKEITVTTKEGVPSEPPQDIQCITQTESIEVYWEPPLKETRNGKIIAYTVYYSTEDGEIRETTTSMSRVLLEDLQPSTNYKIQVDCKTKVGKSPKSAPIVKCTFDIKDPDLLIPTEVHISKKQQTSVEIRWEPLKCTSINDLRGYKIVWRKKEDDSEQENMKEVSLDTKSFSITGLSPWTRYKIRIQAYSDSRSLPSVKLSVMTQEGVPSMPPRNISFIKSSTSIDISWEPPPIYTRNGEIINYTVYYETENGDKKIKQTSALRAVLEDLLPSTNYKVSVDCQTAVGKSHASTPEDVCTKEAIINNTILVQSQHSHASFFEGAHFAAGSNITTIGSARNVNIGSKAIIRDSTDDAMIADANNTPMIEVTHDTPMTDDS